MTIEIYNQICRYLKLTIEGTIWEGHVYAVGGCCRDSILGDPIKDVDLAIDTPNGGIKFVKWLEKKHKVKGRPIFFKRFGTARFTLRQFPDDEIEAVQTRQRNYDADTDQNPEKAFGSILDDSLRRDLTINSLFYDITREKLLDPTGMALDDIAHKRLRTPLPPIETFEDDALRILRCVRFAMRYGHTIDSATLDAMRQARTGLLKISRERLYNEFDKILCCRNPKTAIEILQDVGAMEIVLPELESMRREVDNDGQNLLEHSLRTLETVAANDDSPNPDPTLRWAALLHDIGKLSTRSANANGYYEFPNHESIGARPVRQIMRRARCDSSRVVDAMFLVSNHGVAANRDAMGDKIKDRQIRRLQLACGTRERFDMLMKLVDADGRSHNGEMYNDAFVPHFVKRIDAMVQRGEALFDYQLPITREEIARSTSKNVDTLVAKLLKAACVNPHLTKEDCMSLIGVDRIPEQHATFKKRRKRGGAKRRRKKS